MTCRVVVAVTSSAPQKQRARPSVDLAGSFYELNGTKRTSRSRSTRPTTDPDRRFGISAIPFCMVCLVKLATALSVLVAKLKSSCMGDLGPDLPDDTLIEMVRIPTRIRNAMKFAGLKTVADIRATA